MTRTIHALRVAALAVVVSFAGATLQARLTDPVPQAARAAALKIVVLEGEGAVNIVQQKTAVAPVVEVRDRNDQPVSGAVVKFAIQKGKATFDGARTLTVTTNAAGRATAAGLTPTGSGALQIGASATFQGQTAAVAIGQTTVATAAQAASIAPGTGGATGGGLSHAALAGIVGGAGAGIGAAVIVHHRDSASAMTTVTGPFNGQLVMITTTATVNVTSTCASTRSISGTLTIRFQQNADGSITGSVQMTGTETEVAVTQSPLCSPLTRPSVPFGYGGSVGGSAADIAFGQQTSSTSTTPATVTATNTLAFTGALNNGVITGTLSVSEKTSGQTNPPDFPGVISGSGETTMAVTLR